MRYPTVQHEAETLSTALADYEARGKRLLASRPSRAEIDAYEAEGRYLLDRTAVLERRHGAVVTEDAGPHHRGGGSLTARQAGRELAARWRREG